MGVIDRDDDDIDPREWWLLPDPEPERHHGRRGRPSVEAADGNGYGLRSRAYFKRLKRRAERRRARLEPECRPGYGRHRGYLT